MAQEQHIHYHSPPRDELGDVHAYKLADLLAMINIHIPELAHHHQECQLPLTDDITVPPHHLVMSQPNSVSTTDQDRIKKN